MTIQNTPFQAAPPPRLSAITKTVARALCSDSWVRALPEARSGGHATSGRRANAGGCRSLRVD